MLPKIKPFLLPFLCSSMLFACGDSDDSPKELTPEQATNSAKEMVDSLRKFTRSATYQNSSEMTLMDNVGIATELASEDDINSIFQSLQELTKIIDYAIDANEDELAQPNGSALTSYNRQLWDDWGGSDNISVPVTITKVDNGYQYDVVVNIPSTITGAVATEVNLTATLDSSYDFDSSNDSNAGVDTYTQNENEQQNYSLSGSISTTNVELTINSADIGYDISNTLDETYEDFTWEETRSLEVNNAGLNFDITLEQLTGSNPVAFNGNLILELGAVEQRYDESEDYLCDIDDTSLSAPFGADECTSYASSDMSHFTVNNINFELSGEFSTGGESVKATIAANIDADPSKHALTSSSLYRYVLFYAQDGSFLSSDSSYENEDTELTGETENNYVNADFSVSLDFDLSNVNEVSGITFSVERIGLESANMSLDVIVGDDNLEIDADLSADNLGLTIANNDNNVITLSQNCDENTGICSLSGEMKVQNQVVATLSQDSEDGEMVIEYNDGSFETL